VVTAAGRVLVVDDEEAVRTTVVALLATAGIAASGCDCGEAALRAIGTQRTAVALVDYHLPDMSGLELAATLTERDRELRVILMTGFASIESAIESVGRVDEYLVKPVQPPMLVHAVRNALERNALMAENRSLIERLQRLSSHQALHDPLTGLPNRMLLTDHLYEALSAISSTSHVAVFFVDIDGFKVINESQGHSAGDHLLRQVAERINHSSALGEMAARFGSDKFVVVNPVVGSVEDACGAAQQLLERFKDPFSVGGASHRVNASIGVAVASPGDGTGPDELLRNADTAMYAAKGRGRAQWALYESDMRERAVARYDVEHGLREALEEGQLTLAYQPIVDLATGAMVGAEALLRWERPGVGTVLPGVFLPVAEECGLGPALGTWVLEAALDDLAAWHASGVLNDGFRLWINAFPHQVADPALPDQLALGLGRRGLSAELVGLEIIEEALADIGTTIQVLTALRRMGVSIGLDDFGAGHSNLAWLQDLPITGLKIDRRFVNELDMGSDGKGELIVRGLIGLGTALGLELVGEGVERSAQAELLAGMGCGRAQGFHFGVPGPAEQLWRRAS
jgi:diguanylate cyclase (GGDEF)-like protein